MSIWGSLIGGMIGFSLGGPFGMLLGSLIGGKVSRSRSSFKSFAQPQQVFALALIVLSAKLSKADGQVSREELICLLYTSPSPRDLSTSRMPSSA